EALKHAEEAGLRACGNADAIVVNGNRGQAVGDFCTNPNPGADAGSHKFNGIAQQVREALSEQALIAQNDGERVFDDDVGLVGLEVGIRFDEAGDEPGKVNGLKGDVLEDGLGIIERVLDQFVQA